MKKVIVMFAALLMAVNSMAQSKKVEPKERELTMEVVEIEPTGNKALFIFQEVELKDKEMVEFISDLIAKDKGNFDWEYHEIGLDRYNSCENQTCFYTEGWGWCGDAPDTVSLYYTKIKGVEFIISDSIAQDKTMCKMLHNKMQRIRNKFEDCFVGGTNIYIFGKDSEGLYSVIRIIPQE